MNLGDSLQRALSKRKADRWRAEAESRGQTLIFTHIAKCGGTTFRKMFFDAAAHQPRASLFIPGFTPISHDAVMGRLSRSNRRRLVIIAGHFNYGIHELLGIRNPVYYTVLRDPLKRAISHYYFSIYPKTKKRLSQLSHSERRILLPIISNTMTKTLRGKDWWVDGWDTDPLELRRLQKKALSNLIHKYRCFGLLENLDQSLLLLRSHFPWLDLKLDPRHRLNQTTIMAYQPEAEPSFIRQLLTNLNEPDRELYAGAKAHFESLVHSLTAPAPSDAPML